MPPESKFFGCDVNMAMFSFYYLRQHRTILTAQICRQIFRQTNQIDAGNSGSIDKEICAVWRKRCKKLCGQGASRELRGGALTLQFLKCPSECQFFITVPVLFSDFIVSFVVSGLSAITWQAFTTIVFPGVLQTPVCFLTLERLDLLVLHSH